MNTTRCSISDNFTHNSVYTFQWTTDRDLKEFVGSVGVTDLLEIKFYENRANGQSKGFVL